MPVALVGRTEQLENWDATLRRSIMGRSTQPPVLYGLRGVGKTVLLVKMADMARKQGWLVAQVEAIAGSALREAIGEALYPELMDLVRPKMGQRLLRALKTALSFKASYDAMGNWSFGVDLSATEGGGADTGVLETDLRRLLNDLTASRAEDDRGVVLLVDEAQDLTSDELVALTSLAHSANQKNQNLLIAMAGLPSLPRLLSEAKSYSERLFDFQPIYALSTADAEDAIRKSALEEGVLWEQGAVDHVVSQTGGYPYFLQEFGKDTWTLATESPITAFDAERGVRVGRAVLDDGFFKIRWERATAAERAYMRAMAQDGDRPSLASDIAKRLGKRTSDLGVRRRNLMEKGLIYFIEHGKVAFTVPLMADFINRLPDTD
jgi:hypothetical protein